jgi:hypothetical protein
LIWVICRPWCLVFLAWFDWSPGMSVSPRVLLTCTYAGGFVNPRVNLFFQRGPGHPENGKPECGNGKTTDMRKPGNQEFGF